MTQVCPVCDGAGIVKQASAHDCRTEPYECLVCEGTGELTGFDHNLRAGPSAQEARGEMWERLVEDERSREWVWVKWTRLELRVKLST